MSTTSDAVSELIIGQQVILWISVFIAVVSLTIALYRMYDAWVQHRDKVDTRLAQHAQLSVRVADAEYVRPLLRQRLHECIIDEQQQQYAPDGGGTYRQRLALFDELQQRVGLRPHEKVEARTRAFNAMVDMLRAERPAVVKVDSDAHLARISPRLVREIEVACSNNLPRPAAAMIDSLARFAHPSV